MLHVNLVHARERKRLIERLGDIRGAHRGAEQLLGLAAPAAGAPVALVYWASEPGILALAVGGLAAMRVLRMRRERAVIFPLFERDSA